MSLNVFHRRAYVSSAQVATAAALVLLKEPRMFLEAMPVLMYTEESRHDTPVDPAKPMWHNLGYWKTARTYSQACADLARYLAEAARLGPDDEVLDAGCGCAEQDVLWAREIGCRRIVGIDITPVRVDLAKRRVAEAGLQDRVAIHHGSATALPFPDESFDKVVALESAFHFPTRERFLREAFRVLRPGGRLAVADVLPSPTRRRTLVRRLAVKLFRRCASIPEANIYDRIEYASRLAACGFADVGMDSIGDHVFPGFVRQKALYLQGQEWFSVVVDLQPADFVAEDWLSGWRDCLGLDEYVVVRAEKPFASRG